MKIKDIKNPTVFIALKRICSYLVDTTWCTSLGAGEIEAEFELAKERSKRYKNDVIQLSELDTNLNWGQTKTRKGDKYFHISKTGNFNPWYRGELTLEALLESLESIVEFMDTCDDCIADVEFIHYFHYLKQEKESITDNISYSFWKAIHKDIVKIAQRKFFLEMYSDSVRTTLVEIEHRVRKIVKTKCGQELSGDSLMRFAFSPNNPIIKLDDLSTQEGKDIQRGYMEIFAGSMVGIRNPKSHRNFEIDKERAIHFIFLASLLMYKIDESIKE